uniref:UDP-N-acetylglucosamine--N-acetylmuramyl-(pentapeptide) pyrophosphoryl-undecaprenol N-acetylglucosamine transferase n=1 Tax=uncultured Thiotrichaceae bacterium TaxID=298394 RepID=A0A6S6U7A1_9GAMM|nr:MAG: UDP-N-acetylglucosamine--N-acetylmuramyl-(pentapeptide) pyrophosphoryl-undecaprenol N-acetylglucosamine transferase (EC [uncultured Thiotrichaceae bacterium]
MPGKRPILITAGGTGGHVYPGLAVARALMAQDIPVIWMGTHAGLEATVVPEAGIEMAWLTVTGLRGKGWKTLVQAPLKLTMALFQSVQIMLKHKPVVVLGMGGFVAGPGGLVAALMGKPVVIHEQNAVPGLTNKLLSKVSRRVLEGFPGTFTPGNKVQATGNPVRMDIAGLPAPVERLADRDDEPVHLLVIGGSLGATALNEMVPQALTLLPENVRPIVRHQAGTRNIDDAKEAYSRSVVDADVTAFIVDMAEAYGWADLIICRSGALTVAEVAAAGVASILVPYPYAVDDHQTANGAYLADNGAAQLIQQSDLSPEKLASLLMGLCAERGQLVKMGIMARKLAKPYATMQVAAICAAYAGYDFNGEQQQS